VLPASPGSTSEGTGFNENLNLTIYIGLEMEVMSDEDDR